MASLLEFAQRFKNDEAGQDLIEYALLAGLVSVAAITMMVTLGHRINTGYRTVGNSFSNVLAR